MLYARSLGCTWVYHILCSQKNKSCGSSYPLIWDVSKMVPADPRFDERGFFIQRINKDFSQFSQKKHTSTSRLLHFFVPKPIKTPKRVRATQRVPNWSSSSLDRMIPRWTAVCACVVARPRCDGSGGSQDAVG